MISNWEKTFSPHVLNKYFSLVRDKGLRGCEMILGYTICFNVFLFLPYVTDLSPHSVACSWVRIISHQSPPTTGEHWREIDIRTICQTDAIIIPRVDIPHLPHRSQPDALAFTDSVSHRFVHTSSSQTIHTVSLQECWHTSCRHSSRFHIYIPDIKRSVQKPYIRPFLTSKLHPL